MSDGVYELKWCKSAWSAEGRKECFRFTSVLVLTPLLALSPHLVTHPPPFPLSPPPTPVRAPNLLIVQLIFVMDQIKGGHKPYLPSFCWCLEASGNFPPWLNSTQCPISGPLYSIQLDKPLNSAVPSVPQACPLFAVCIYLFSLHGLHNIAGTQRPRRPSHALPGEVRVQKKPLNPELSTVLRHSVFPFVSSVTLGQCEIFLIELWQLSYWLWILYNLISHSPNHSSDPSLLFLLLLKYDWCLKPKGRNTSDNIQRRSRCCFQTDM